VPKEKPHKKGCHPSPGQTNQKSFKVQKAVTWEGSETPHLVSGQHLQGSSSRRMFGDQGRDGSGETVAKSVRPEEGGENTSPSSEGYKRPRRGSHPKK